MTAAARAVLNLLTYLPPRPHQRGTSVVQADAPLPLLAVRHRYLPNGFLTATGRRPATARSAPSSPSSAAGSRPQWTVSLESTAARSS